MPIRRILRYLRIIWVIWGIGFTLWLLYSFQAQGVDASVLQSDLLVQVGDTPESLSFTPIATQPSSGLIFLPGGMVDPKAYAPMGRALAEQGIAVVIIKLPWRSAFTEAQQAAVYQQVQQLSTADQRIAWALGGHSRGAALAAQFALQPGFAPKQLILIGTSHPKEPSASLASLTLPITKIYASADGLASKEEVLANAAYLPADTYFIAIEGGNHAQFGWYGSQLGDSAATISRAEQQRILIEALISSL